MDDYTIIARAWAEESPRSDTIAKSQIQPEDKRRSVARPTIHYASMGTCGQFDGCAIGVRLSHQRMGRTYIAIGSIYRISPSGPPLPMAKYGNGSAFAWV